jgi:predicted lipid-binding transport protein (Tim44 family)
MNTSPASNPFTGLKGALAGLMSGGWLGLLLGLLFRRRIAPMLAALEGLFAQWKAGTLPMPVAPAPVRRKEQPVRAQTAAPRARRGSRPAARRRPIARVAASPVRPAAWHRPGIALPASARPCALLPLRRRARCTKKRDGTAESRTSKLLRYRI